MDYGLLSVRGDSAIVVLDWMERNVSPTPFSHAEVIKKAPFYPLIYRAGEGGGVVNTSVGFLGGGALGGIIGLLLTPPPQHTNNALVALAEVANTSIFAYIFIGCLVGAIAGVLIVNAFPLFSPSKYLSLRFAKDRAFLRSIAAYPDKEPDEMQYIK